MRQYLQNKKTKIVLSLVFVFSLLTQFSVAQESSLFTLVKSGKHSAVSALLKKGNSKIERRNINGDTALLVAARRGDIKMLKLLVENGADINAMDHKKRDVLNIAITTKNLRLTRKALDLGADPTMVTSIYDGGAIIYGSAKGVDKIVEMLIKAGAPVNRINNVGWTALLEVAILGDGSQPYVAITKMLLKAGADKLLLIKMV